MKSSLGLVTALLVISVAVSSACERRELGLTPEPTPDKDLRSHAMVTPPDDEGMVPFTEEDVFQGLRLYFAEDQARQQAREIGRVLSPASDWAASEEFLFLVSLGSESGRQAVQRLRKEIRDGAREDWIREQRRTGADEAAAAARWEGLTAGEDRAWEERRERFRRALPGGDEPRSGT